MNKKNEIIRVYTEAEGHATAKQITDTLINEGVEVTYNYVTMVIRSYKKGINDNYNKVINDSDTINDSIIDSINDNYKKVITMLSQIITKLSVLEAALDPCNTRARLSTYTRCTEGISLENIKESSLTITEGPSIEGSESADNADQTRLDNVDNMDLEDINTDTPSEEANNTDNTPTDDNTPTEMYTDPDNVDQTELDNVDFKISDTDIPSEPSTGQVEYADIPPTDGITTTTVSQAPVNTTTTITKGEYWASWKRFVESIPTLSKEERDNYYQRYFKQLSKLYQGEELGNRRVKLSNQYNYLCDQADKEFRPDPSALISVPDTDDPMAWAEQFIICWAQKLRTNRLVYTKQKEYADYYTAQLRQYLIDHNRATDGDLDRVEAIMDQYLF